MKKVAVEIPRVFQLCTPTVFIVSEYFVFSEYDYTLPSPTEADKQRICWSVWDADGRDLLEEYQSVIKQNGEKLEIECVPFDWHNRIIKIGAQFDSPPENEMFSGKPESAEVYDWIATIKKAEAAYPHLDGVQMTNAMRRLASYDDEGFRLTYGETPPGETLTPKDLLIQKDIDKLTKWTKHSVVGGIETGIVKDADGNDLAAGHVLTGISAGVYRDKDIDMAGKYAQKNWGTTSISCPCNRQLNGQLKNGQLIRNNYRR
ncbi:MAG: hypothetical protein IPL59_08485 [Candidatus Competibacteraceae bacterium]|nr:hypothetical protein [Candidatus Competibacteraceae bacterium]